MAQKSWVDVDAFCAAYLKALELHNPKGRDKIDLVASLAKAEASRWP